jgi:hypothetical protein
MTDEERRAMFAKWNDSEGGGGGGGAGPAPEGGN